jgi:hypothetical protein
MTRHAESGITLIEVLIAVSLLSLLSLGVLMAMRIGFNTMDKTDAHLLHNRRVANARNIIENELQGLMPTHALFHAQPQTGIYVPFLEFEPASMRFVTSYSLSEAWRGRPRIAALQVIPGDRGEGVRLILNETPYVGPSQAGALIAAIDQGLVRFAPIVAGDRSFVLADRLAYCRFSYLESRLEPAKPVAVRVWRSDWPRPLVLPLGIRIEMAPLDKSPGELRVSTVTVALNINRNPNLGYSDAE